MAEGGAQHPAGFVLALICLATGDPRAPSAGTRGQQAAACAVPHTLAAFTPAPAKAGRTPEQLCMKKVNLSKKKKKKKRGCWGQPKAVLPHHHPSSHPLPGLRSLPCTIWKFLTEAWVTRPWKLRT